MKSPPLSASRVALVAPAMISSTLCESAIRLNFDRVWSAAAMAASGQAAPVQAPGPQADHVLLAVDHVKGQVRTDLHDDHVDRIGSDVDGGYTHSDRQKLSGARLACYTREIYSEPEL